jgi:DNA modification methylase
MDWPADKIERRKVDALIPYARNARTHSDEQVAQIAASIKEWGWTTPVLIDEDGEIIAGHGRVMAARKLGIEEVPTMTATGWSKAQKQAYVLADNQLPQNAGWDMDLLSVEMKDLDADGFDLSLIGFNDDMLANMLVDETEGLTDEDAVPDVPDNPVTVLGDVWLLGDHRLMCGDSTSIDAVEKLMAGKKASLVVTDPPWNVAYGTNIASDNPMNYKKREILNDNFATTKEWDDFLAGVTSCISAVTLPGCPLYCVMGASEWPAIDAALRGADFHWSSTIIWAKDQLVMSRKDYHTQYEPMWYGWKGDAKRIWVVKDRKQSDLWKCDRPKASPLHPTTKPVELAERAILNSSNAGVVTYEPFGGSGWMLIASEKTGRINCSMELDPKYCDVIVKRWEDFTGQQAKLEDSGETFPTIKENAA